MGICEEIRALPEDEQLDAALDLIRTLIRPDLAMLDHYFRTYGLTRPEACLLDTMRRNAGRVCSRELLMAALNEHYLRSVDDEPDMKIIDVTICKLRRKLKSVVKIETAWGLGYTLAAEMAERIAVAPSPSLGDFAGVVSG